MTQISQSPFKLVGCVEAVLVLKDPDSSVSTLTKKIVVTRNHGVVGDRHAGTRLADGRETDLIEFGLPKGIEIANHREVSLVSTEDFDKIAQLMGLPGTIPPGCLGENVIVSGIPDFTQLPSGTLLFFRKPAPPGATSAKAGAIRTAVLAVWKENGPCLAPGEAIQARFPDVPGLASKFPKAAMGRRGLVASVYVSGHIHEGDEIVVKVPGHHIYGVALG